MASPSAANATQQTGNYAPGSLAASPRRHAGGVRRRDESPEAFRNRMDTQAYLHGQAPQGMPPMAVAPSGGQTRQDRIIAARMDGTFDTKRNQFNTANAGKLAMDEAGNINPITAAPAPAAPSSPPAASPPVNPVPPVNQVTPPTPKLPAGGSSPLRKPVGRINGQPASLVLEGMKSGSPSPSLPASPSSSTGLRPPVTRTASGELVQPGTPMNPNARWSKPAIPSAVTPPMAAQAPAAAPPMTPAAPVPATSITTTDQAWAKKQKAMRPTPMSGPGAPTLEGRAQALQNAARLSQSTQGPMPRPMSNKTTLPPHLTAPANGFSPEFHRLFDPTPVSTPTPSAAATPPTTRAVTPPRPRLDAAQAQAIKNPQGLSARLNPPNAAPVTLEEDPIAKPIIAAGKAVGNVLSYGGFTIADSIRNQAAKNPGGLAAKIRRFTGMTNG